MSLSGSPEHPGSEYRRIYPPGVRQRANEGVSILYVCQLIGMGLPEGMELSRNMKVYCPFGDLNHKDGGIEPAMRIYPETNSAWCFAEQEYFSPTKLYALSLDIDENDAAKQLLLMTGQPLTSQLTLADVNLSTSEPPPDPYSLGAALTVACSGLCERTGLSWNELQFDGPVAEKLSQCLSLLEKVRSSAQATQWLSVAKQAMRQEIMGVVPR